LSGEAGHTYEELRERVQNCKGSGNRTHARISRNQPNPEGEVKQQSSLRFPPQKALAKTEWISYKAALAHAGASRAGVADPTEARNPTTLGKPPLIGFSMTYLALNDLD